MYVNVGTSNLRSGPGAQYESLGVVASGQELEVTTTQGDWLKVYGPGGRPSWIIKHATTSTPPTPVVVRSLERKIKDLESDNDRLAKEIRGLSDSRQDLELEASKLKADVQVLASRNDELKSWSTVLYVLLGLLVLITGWVLGFIAGTFRRQAEDKRYNALIKEATTKKA